MKSIVLETYYLRQRLREESLHPQQPVSMKSDFSDVLSISLVSLVHTACHHIMFLSENTYQKAQTIRAKLEIPERV